ncbi:hypothetical protein THAOC_35376, partial [Thalassiosira oceanica]
RAEVLETEHTFFSKVTESATLYLITFA